MSWLSVTTTQRTRPGDNTLTFNRVLNSVLILALGLARVFGRRGLLLVKNHLTLWHLNRPTRSLSDIDVLARVICTPEDWRPRVPLQEESRVKVLSTA
jgi:hypothetical protein